LFRHQKKTKDVLIVYRVQKDTKTEASTSGGPDTTTESGKAGEER